MIRRLIRMKKAKIKKEFKKYLYTREYLFRPVYKFKRSNRISSHKKHFYVGNDSFLISIKNENFQI